MKPPVFHGPRGCQRVTCCYCKCQLDAPTPERDTSLTWDHIRPESDDGWKKVPCCRKCNFLKDNLPPDDWFWFIATHPRWWKEFANPAQVKRVVREFRFSQAQAGARPYRKLGARLPYVGDAYK
jgi:hypothetical protein